MSPAIHRSAGDRAYLVPGPRTTDAIGEALRDAYRRVETMPADIAACLTALDRAGRG